jgi:hypothetical protein
LNVLLPAQDTSIVNLIDDSPVISSTEQRAITEGDSNPPSASQSLSSLLEGPDNLVIPVTTGDIDENEQGDLLMDGQPDGEPSFARISNLPFPMSVTSSSIPSTQLPIVSCSYTTTTTNLITQPLSSAFTKPPSYVPNAPDTTSIPSAFQSSLPLVLTDNSELQQPSKATKNVEVNATVLESTNIDEVGMHRKSSHVIPDSEHTTDSYHDRYNAYYDERDYYYDPRHQMHMRSKHYYSRHPHYPRDHHYDPRDHYYHPPSYSRYVPHYPMPPYYRYDGSHHADDRDYYQYGDYGHYYDHYHNYYAYHPDSLSSDAYDHQAFYDTSGYYQPYGSASLADESSESFFDGNYQTIEPSDNFEESCDVPVEEYSSVDTVPARETPQPFSYPHVVVRFGFGGQLVTVLPFTLNSTYSAKVDIYSVQDLVPEIMGFSDEVTAFPGPLLLSDTHKSVVIKYCSQRLMHENANSDEGLLWKYLILLCQQNGVIVPSDISDLLLQDVSKSPRGIGVGGAGESKENDLDEFRNLLLSGRKKVFYQIVCYCFSLTYRMLLSMLVVNRYGVMPSCCLVLWRTHSEHML